MSMLCEIWHVDTPAKISVSVMSRSLCPSHVHHLMVWMLQSGARVMGWKLHPSKLRYSPLKTVVWSSLAGETTASEHGHQQTPGKGEGAAGACWAEGMRKLQHQPQDALQLQVVGCFLSILTSIIQVGRVGFSGNGNNLSKSSWNIALSVHA